MEFEDILKDVGGWGKYQRNLLWVFMVPVSVFVSFFIMTNIFLMSVPDHWCYVPELEESRLNLTQKRLLIPPDSHRSCSMYKMNYTDDIDFENISISLNSTELVPCVNGWSYDKSNYESTATTKWNLVCDKSHYVTLVLTLQNVGGIIGTPIFSVLSDKFGRKIVYFLVAIVTTSCNLICPFAQDFTTFAILRTLNGSIYPSILILPYILVMEITLPDKRTRTSYVWNFSWVLGMCLMPLVVYLGRSWSVLCWVNAALGGIVLVYWNFVPESPRWLISQKRYEDAESIMLKIAEKNGYLYNTKTLLSKIQTVGIGMEKEKQENQKQFFSFIKFPKLRKHFLILTACSLANHTIYSTIHYNIGNLEGNEFVIFFLLALAEAPGDILVWLTMDRIGRRWCNAGGFMLGGLVCALPLTGLPYSDIASSIMGKFIVAGLFMVTDQQLCELYPTVVRSFGMGASKCISSGLALGIPYVILLTAYGKAIPFVFIMFTCFLTGILSSFLPETLNKNLPQTIADGEKFGKDQKYFSFRAQPNDQKEESSNNKERF